MLGTDLALLLLLRKGFLSLGRKEWGGGGGGGGGGASGFNKISF